MLFKFSVGIGCFFLALLWKEELRASTSACVTQLSKLLNLAPKAEVSFTTLLCKEGGVNAEDIRVIISSTQSFAKISTGSYHPFKHIPPRVGSGEELQLTSIKHAYNQLLAAEGTPRDILVLFSSEADAMKNIASFVNQPKIKNVVREGMMREIGKDRTIDNVEYEFKSMGIVVTAGLPSGRLMSGYTAILTGSAKRAFSDWNKTPRNEPFSKFMPSFPTLLIKKVSSNPYKVEIWGKVPQRSKEAELIMTFEEQNFKKMTLFLKRMPTGNTTQPVFIYTVYPHESG